MDLFVILIVSENMTIFFNIEKIHFFLFCLVASIDGIRFIDGYLQEQLDKVLNKTLDNHKPTLTTASDFIQILFNTNNVLPTSTNTITTTTNVSNESNILKVSYCYSTKEWRCLYRCEIDSSLKDSSTSKVDLTLFGSVNNPTEEDWTQIELTLVANELEILNNNKTTTTPPAVSLDRSDAESRSGSSGGMQIFIKTLTGKTVTLDVCTNKDSSYLFIFPMNNRFQHQILFNKLKQKFKIKKVFLQINNV